MTDPWPAFVASVVTHPLLVVRFHLDADLAVVFHAHEDDRTGALVGVGLTPVRQSRGAGFVVLHPALLTEVFAPKITPVGTGGRTWLWHMQPLREEIRVEKRASGKYVCFYPFPEHKCNGQIQSLWVEGSPPPQPRLAFTVHATYQATKDAPKQTLQARVECPAAFTQRLLQLTQA